MKLTDLPKHHAILLENNEREALGLALYSELQAISPVHRFFNQTVLDIETARSIITWAQTPYNEEKIALVSFHTAGLEAQNALLKIIEEPRDGVRFIFLTSNTAKLIGTVMSRVLYVRDVMSTEITKDAKDFLSTPHALRMKSPSIIALLARVDEEDR